MSVDGVWRLVVNSPLGKQNVSTTFETTGDGVVGKLVNHSANGITSDIFDGTVDGDTLRWKTKLQQMKITLSFDVQVTGDRLAGKVKVGMLGSFDVSGERESAAG